MQKKPPVLSIQDRLHLPSPTSLPLKTNAQKNAKREVIVLRSQLLLPADENIIHRSTDEFGELIITNSPLFRTLYFGNEKKQSTMYVNHPDVLVLSYTQAMMSALIFNSSPANALMIGLGGGSMVKFLLKHSPSTAIEVVEIRKHVIQLAHAYFSVPEQHQRLQTHHTDAAQFVTGKLQTKSYTLISLDAFDGTGPASIMHSGLFLQQCKDLLSNNGILCINLWNRRGDQFQKKLHRINKLFNGACLALETDKMEGNAIIFAFKNPEMILDVNTYQRSAAKLKNTTGIDFESFLSLYYKQKNSFLYRWLKY